MCLKRTRTTCFALQEKKKRGHRYIVVRYIDVRTVYLHGSSLRARSVRKCAVESCRIVFYRDKAAELRDSSAGLTTRE